MDLGMLAPEVLGDLREMVALVGHDATFEHGKPRATRVSRAISCRLI
jgi:hypothetical protein